MGGLKLTGGHLTRTASGHLAICEPYTPTPCECLDGSTWLNSGDLTVTVTGTNLPTDTHYGSGSCTNPYTGATGPSIAGTYIVPCGGYLCKIIAVPVGCDTASARPFYVARLIVNYYSSDGIEVRLTHGTITNPLLSNPYPTVSNCTSTFLVFAYKELVFAAATRDPKTCVSGDITPTPVLTGPGSINPFTGVTLTMELAAAS